MRPTAVVLMLSLLLASAAVRAEEPATADPQAPSDVEGDAEVAARLDFLVARLDDGRAYADHWARGWIALFTLSAITSAGWAATRTTPALRTDAIVGAAKSTLGAATHVTLIQFSANRGADDVRALPRDTPGQRRAALQVAEQALRANARDASQRTFWLRHLGNLLVNVAGGLVVGLAHGDWRTAGISTSIGIAGGEAVIWSQPWRAPSDWRDYEERFGSTSR